jgi:predicted signal transduction protein with EAL and GGDEF domain
VARRLTQGLRRSDTVARLGGDEFIVLMQNCRGRDCARRLAAKIIALFERPFILMGHRLDIRTSIGISLYPTDGEDTETLVKNADLAMYQAKEHGRGQFVFYEPKFGEQVQERLFLESELRDALRRNELALHFQPQFDLKSGRIVGSEALLRWRHPVRGMIPPAKFIPVAEDTGLIVEIGEWVLETAARQVAEWLSEGLGPHRLAVNLSGVQIERGDVVAVVGKILRDTGLPPASLELEVTETYVMRKAKQSVRVLEGLRDLGVAIAIDDFGTGHSSLAYLQRLPVDKLKIDRSFVTDLPLGESQAAIARAVIALGHSLRLQVLAEGVETVEQANFLREHGCDEVQGFFYGRPVEAEELAGRLAEQVLADRKSTRLNSSHRLTSRMPSSA